MQSQRTNYLDFDIGRLELLTRWMGMYESYCCPHCVEREREREEPTGDMECGDESPFDDVLRIVNLSLSLVKCPKADLLICFECSHTKVVFLFAQLNCGISLQL